MTLSNAFIKQYVMQALNKVLPVILMQFIMN